MLSFKSLITSRGPPRLTVSGNLGKNPSARETSFNNIPIAIPGHGQFDILVGFDPAKARRLLGLPASHH